MRAQVEACGGVIIRCRAEGPEVLLVHRPKYDDWTFPKGKIEPNERYQDCALREVREETGLRCRLKDELASTHYSDSRGRSKTVRYWIMDPLNGDFSPHQEVDEICWLPLTEASKKLTYDRDRDVLTRYASRKAIS